MMTTTKGDRPPSDPTLQALGTLEHQEMDRVAKIEAAVDSGDVDGLHSLLGGTREAAEEMIVRLRAPDTATREQWLDRWDAERKTRRLMPRILALSGGALAAAAAAAFLFMAPPPAPVFTVSAAEIVSRPSEHLSGNETHVNPEVTALHKDVAGGLIRITITSAEAQPGSLEAAACWKTRDNKIDIWAVPSAIERDDETHSTVGVKIPDDARGEGHLILLLANKGELPDAAEAREVCAGGDTSRWKIVPIAQPILVAPNVSRKD